MKVADVIVAVLLVIGGLNWGLVGFFGVDLVAALFGAGSPLARTIYALVAVRGVPGGAVESHPAPLGDAASAPAGAPSECTAGPRLTSTLKVTCGQSPG